MNSLIRTAPLRFIKKISKSLAIEIYLRGLSLTILGEVFKVTKTIPCDLKMRNELHARNPKRVRYDTETTYIFLVSKTFEL